MYQPIHHKYRPQTFSGLISQDAVTTTLTNALTSGRIAPAYLFTGPRGTGKTSSARILAKSLNCQSFKFPTEQPCGSCNSCRAIAGGFSLDVIELDAASNSGVENIREIVERCQFAPVECRYKVYVIDEAHSLSSQAFQALLKTLEEPPANVVFVLCTTEAHKVPATIASRCQRFDFKRIKPAAMVQHLKLIAANESINITEDAIRLVSQLSSGCMRDAECLLDQLSLLDTTITSELIWEVAGTIPEQDLLTLIIAIAANNDDTVISVIRNLLESGKEPLVILHNIASFYCDLLIAKTSPHKYELVLSSSDIWQKLCETAKSWETATILQAQQHLKSSEVQIKLSSQPQLWLEITVLGLLQTAKVPNTITNAVDTTIYNTWKKPSDAITWASEQLPHISDAEIRRIMDSIIPVNGKKAPGFAKAIFDLKAKIQA